MEELKRKTDIMLRSVLVSVGRTGLALRWLDKEYKSITYSAIPYQEMGFSSLEKYIKSIPEVATLSRDADGEYVVHGVPSEADKHVAKLIAKQKKPKRKAKAKARRPVHASMHKSGVGRSVALHRAPVRKSPQAASSRVSVAPSRVGVAPSRFGTTPRFVPPRMMRAPGTNTSVDRNGVEQQIAQQIQQQAKNMVAASLNSSRTVQLNKSQPGLFASLPQQTAVCGNKINGMASNNRQVTVVSRQEEPPHRKNWKKKAKSQGSGPNWGGMEVTFESGHDNQNESFKRTVKVSNSSSAQVDSLSKEELEIYSRIKKKFLVPHEYPGDNIIVYPPKLLEEKPKVSHTQPHQANGGSPQHVEIYTLRPQDLPEKGTATKVSISHVDSPAHFFIHYKHTWDSLDALSAELNEFFQNPSNGKDPLPSLKQGMFCCAQFKEDDAWYRARITEMKTQGDTPQANVIYVDFGNNEILPVSRLRMLRKEHAELPMIAVLCALDGALPTGGGKNWSTASIERFQELCSASEVLHMRVVRGEGYLQTLFVLDSSACTVSLHGLPKTKNDEVLLKVKHMTLNKDIVAQVIQRDGNTASVELYDTSSEVDININAMLQRLVIPDVDMAPVLPKVGEQIEAFVTYVTPEGHVFIQIHGGGTTRLNELMEDIAEHYSQPTKAAEFVSSPHKNKMCCAKCSDGVWYRAIVTNVLPDRQVEVQYVDFGNIEALPLASLREPTRAISHVNSLPFQALECKLEGTEKQGLTEEQTETIIERDVLLEVVQMADVPLVRLFISSENEEDALVNVGEVLGLETEEQKETHDEAAAAGIDSTALEYNDDDKDSVTSESSTEACRPVDDGNMTTALLSKPWVDICILEAIDPSTFVFQCLELLQQKEELEEKMQKYYTVSGVEPVGEDLARWSQEAIDLFGELTADKKLVAKPRGLVANRSRLTNEETKVSLELYDTSEGNEDVLIADVLVNKSLAKKINEG
ncbi:tudor domain-containing protein 7-like [Pocillopora damicornis]|uniref:tudor domain-containing protein 7-like n=1 Tax=Pocillopora damicornis TaxID=46731 RepID=UPI000F553C76|nr:tudor domain-containing protein 7-like [Pocillopora damicornis]